MFKKYFEFLKNNPIFIAIIAVTYAIICLKTLKTETYFQMLIVRSLLCMTMIFFLYQISGDKSLLVNNNSAHYVIKASLGFLIFAIIVGILALFASYDLPLWDNVPIQLLNYFVLCIFVGLFEEIAFRAIINDAIIYQFRDKKYVFILSGLCCSLVFGIAHVIGVDLNSFLAWIQALCKIASTAIIGLALLILYWKTRNIWACGLVHGLYDFFAAFSEGIYQNQDFHGYVLSDDLARPVIIIYIILMIVVSIITLSIWKKVGKSIDWQDIRDNW